MALWHVVSPLLLLSLLHSSTSQLVVDDHTLASCQDYYTKLGNRTDGNYLLEISPFVMVELYCSGQYAYAWVALLWM